jgi:hypothetical protein
VRGREHERGQKLQSPSKQTRENSKLSILANILFDSEKLRGNTKIELPIFKYVLHEIELMEFLKIQLPLIQLVE